MRHVRQTNRSSGCGPACIAMIANVDEQAAQLAMFPDCRTRSFRSQWGDIKAALDRLSAPHEPRAKPAASWTAIRKLSIVACGLDKDENWHWVVFDPEKQLVYDPLKEEAVAPSRVRRKPFSYLAVSEIQ